MLATIVNIACSFSGQLQWKQLGFNSSPLDPTNYLNVPSLKMSVIWPGGRHSSSPWGMPSESCIFFFQWSWNLTITSLSSHFICPRCFSLISNLTWGEETELWSRILSQTESYSYRAPFHVLWKKICASLRNEGRFEQKWEGNKSSLEFKATLSENWTLIS